VPDNPEDAVRPGCDLAGGAKIRPGIFNFCYLGLAFRSCPADDLFQKLDGSAEFFWLYTFSAEPFFFWRVLSGEGQRGAQLHPGGT
jgi:hypothetical protein